MSTPSFPSCYHEHSTRPGNARRAADSRHQMVATVVGIACERGSETHVDDVGPGSSLANGARGVFNGGNDCPEGPAAVMQGLDRDDRRTWRDSDRSNAVIVCRNDSCHVSGVSECRRGSDILIECKASDE